MIISDSLNRTDLKRECFYNGVIFDTNALLIFVMDKYVKINPHKKHLLRNLNITNSQINCLNTLITNFRISKIIITPHILSEFLNKIKNKIKQDYKNIKRECLEDLEKFGEIYIEKDILIKHEHFFDFGNDISIALANEEQLKNFNYSCVVSFDGRFIRKFYEKTNHQIIAFDLDTLQYFF